jgi:selenoprotein W-related protein
MAQELLITFSEELRGVMISPSETSGHFSVLVGEKEVWERKRDGGFPDVKQLKQLVRDEVAPDKSLGHSDGDRS